MLYQLGVNPTADIASGRIAEVRSRSMSCNCMTRTSQQECRGILERLGDNSHLYRDATEKLFLYTIYSSAQHINILYLVLLCAK